MRSNIAEWYRYDSFQTLCTQFANMGIMKHRQTYSTSQVQGRPTLSLMQTEACTRYWILILKGLYTYFKWYMWYVRFATVSLKALSHQECMRYS